MICPIEEWTVGLELVMASENKRGFSVYDIRKGIVSKVGRTYAYVHIDGGVTGYDIKVDMETGFDAEDHRQFGDTLRAYPDTQSFFNRLDAEARFAEAHSRVLGRSGWSIRDNAALTTELCDVLIRHGAWTGEYERCIREPDLQRDR